MTWKHISEQHALKYDRDYVSLDDAEELRYLMDSITNNFRYLRREKVKSAVIHCCKTMDTEVSTVEFLKSVAEQLSQTE